jgi:hypothetical protein
VATDIEPAGLAHLVDFAERPRTEDWSLRAALVRYAQPQPQRVDDLLDVVRRTEFAIAQHTRLLRGDGAALWAALDGGPATDAEHAHLIGLLRVARELDDLGDVLAGWARDVSIERPDAAVDAVTTRVAARLDELGVPREEPRPPGRQRG